MQNFPKFCISLLLVIFITSCTSVSYKEDPEQYQDEIIKLKGQVKSNPNNIEARRDLGIIYFRTADYNNANLLLKKVFVKNPKDAQTILYYGMTLEFLQKKDDAIQVYKKYTDLSSSSTYRSKIEGRFLWLTRQKIQEQMRTLLLQETQLTEDKIIPDKIAVFPFSLITGDEEYNSLGRGLAEMIITDLSQVKKIQLIERTRIQALLEEMALGQTGVIEEKTAPRFGKLLGAGKIVHGNFSIAGKNDLKLDAAFWDVLNQQFPKFTEMSDALDNLFKLEKDIVFNIVDEMGIQLTAEEKRKIQIIPTKNMQAFMAYCKGLESQDNGDFKSAYEQFINAYKMDPNFSAANENTKKSENINHASGTKEQFAGITGTGKTVTIGTDRLVAERLRNLNDNIGSNFNPGDDNREAGEEAANAGADIGLSDLPNPPRPPGN